MAEEKWFTQTDRDRFESWDAVAAYLQPWRNSNVLLDALIEFFLLHGNKDPFYVYVGQGNTGCGGESLILEPFRLARNTTLALVRCIGGSSYELRVYGTDINDLIKRARETVEAYITVRLDGNGLQISLPSYWCEMPMGSTMRLRYEMSKRLERIIEQVKILRHSRLIILPQPAGV